MAARRRGLTVYGEVCPHHLLFDVADHEGPDALRYVMTPPLRTATTAPALLAGLRDGGARHLASDHCHLRLDRDKLPVPATSRRSPTGLPGIGARLPLGFGAAWRAPPAERLVRGRLRGAGAHLRAVSAQGRDRRGQRRRRRGVGSVRAVPAHARRDQRRARLVAVRGDRGARARSGTCSPRGDHVVGRRALRRRRAPRRATCPRATSRPVRRES